MEGSIPSPGTLRGRIKRKGGSPVCGKQGCSRGVKARGLCSTHYEKMRVRGALPPLSPQPSTKERFWAKVQVTPGCWEWTAATTGGYGRFYLEGKREMSHRVSFEWEHGEIPHGKVVDHLCFNRKCVNPKHLRLTSLEENARRHKPDCPCSACDPGPHRERFKICPQGHVKSEVGTNRAGTCLICSRKTKRDHMRKSRSEVPRTS